MKRALSLLLTVLLVCCLLSAVPAAAADAACAQPHWVSAWSTSPVDASLSELGALSGVSVPVANVSSRVVVRPTMTGDQIRLVFSNEHS